MESFDITTVLILVAGFIILALACVGGSELVDGAANRIVCIEVCKGPPVESSVHSCMCKDGLKEQYVQPTK